MLSMTLLENHTALITGGNGGIGFGLAEGLARAGADVAIWGTDPDKTAAAGERLAAHGTRVDARVCDVTDEAGVAEAFAATVAVLGRVDSCFANAGTGGRPAKFQDQTLEGWRHVMAVNGEGTFLTFREAVRHMIAREGGGSLIATSSLTAIEAAPRSEAYAASKAGVIALVKSLAVGLARHGIRANALMPGWIETEMSAPMLQSEGAAAAILPRVPARRWGLPEDLAGAAVYLAGDASRYHTGDVLVIDGGYHLF
jgi:NAD(P)-dependent dehydrogenase (short-subunit alcohol dehydrogenase family)